jgi:hypothetical protein
MVEPELFPSRAQPHDADRPTDQKLGRARRRRAACPRWRVRLGPAAPGLAPGSRSSRTPRQTWTGHGGLEGRATRGSFDIGERKGCWIEGGQEQVAWAGRPADRFVLAWPPVLDPARVDHRDPRPWLSFVVPEPALPVRQKRLGLALIERREQTSVADVAFEPAR